MTTGETISLFAAIASVISAIAAIGVGAIAWWQLGALVTQTRLQGERERRWRTLDMCMRLDNDPMMEATTKCIWIQSDGGKKYDDMRPVQRDIINLLNFRDSIAIGIQQGFYVEDVAHDHLRLWFDKAAREFLAESRAKQLDLNRDNYTHMLDLVEKWKKPETKYKIGVH